MKSKYEIDVRFRDIDAMGHVNNAVYLSYFEQARIGFFNAIVHDKWDWNKLGVLLARNEVNYIAPLLLNEKAWIETRCSKMGGKSLTFEYEIKKEINGVEQLITTGLSILVCFDASSHQTIPVPQIWRDKITVLAE